MTHRPTSSHTTVRRSLFAVAAATSLALAATACMDVGSIEDDGEFFASVNCAGLKPWAVGETFAKGRVITFDDKAVNTNQTIRKAFTTLQNIRVDAPDWTPPNLTGHWALAGTCVNGAPPPVTDTPPPPVVAPPPVNNPPPPVVAPTPPPPNNAPGNRFAPNDPANFNQLTCLNANNVQQPFDKAGGANVGNRQGRQFITGRCTSNADCGSANCAFPCGVCSGKDVVGKPDAPINGKTGSGFTCPPGTEGRSCGQRSNDGR